MASLLPTSGRHRHRLRRCQLPPAQTRAQEQPVPAPLARQSERLLRWRSRPRAPRQPQTGWRYPPRAEVCLRRAAARR